MPSINKIQLSLNRNTTYIKGFFFIFYAVGVAGMSFPYTFPLFLQLTPFALLLTAGALALYHGAFNKNEIILIGVIYLTGFFIEAVGVNTGIIFGDYLYGDSLGIKIFKTPLIIGLNWLLLVYLTASVAELTKLHSAGKVVLGSLLMLGYDVILEQVAPAVDMWYWQNGNAPWQNYLSWFILSLAFHALSHTFRVNMKNKLGPFLFVCQTVFFLLLFIFKFAI